MDTLLRNLLPTPKSCLASPCSGPTLPLEPCLASVKRVSQAEGSGGGGNGDEGEEEGEEEEGVEEEEGEEEEEGVGEGALAAAAASSASLSTAARTTAMAAGSPLRAAGAAARREALASAMEEEEREEVEEVEEVEATTLPSSAEAMTLATLLLLLLLPFSVLLRRAKKGGADLNGVSPRWNRAGGRCSAPKRWFVSVSGGIRKPESFNSRKEKNPILIDTQFQLPSKTEEVSPPRPSLSLFLCFSMRLSAVPARAQRAELGRRPNVAAANRPQGPQVAAVKARRGPRSMSSVSLVVSASSPSSSSSSPSSSSSSSPPLPDFNALQTRLLRAIEAEDYAEAARARDALREASESEGRGSESDKGGGEASSPSLLPAWRDLPLGPGRAKTPEWLAQRAEQLGYLYPTDIQRRAYEALSVPGRDAVVVAQTGSGKTLAFLMPLLSRLDYGRSGGGGGGGSAAAVEAFEGDGSSFSPSSGAPPPPPPQLIIVVPTRDLGVQTALLVYRLLGGSVSTR